MGLLLGFEIGTGRRVEIPETGHLACFGQTQLSGKTTALEGMTWRGGFKAVAFITKQGEGGFLTGRMIPPYFSEPTNDEEFPLWKWVKSILEANQQRRMNFEESWIIRACEDPEPAKTLAEVHANIKGLIEGEFAWVEKGRGKVWTREKKWIRKPVSGMNAGVYTSLNAYFNIVMPQLARLPYTKKLELGPGLNVMDLREYAMETQALVIRSVMEWVYQHERNVRVIVPESQDFVPQGKNSPVKMACENLVRKAGANHNFMWLDSQDMAAVDKIMLRACSIVLCGVQTEMHEIDRTIGSMFDNTLKPIDIARLKIGEFFVRTPGATLFKVYVQPAWMDSELHAQAIAKGEEAVSSARQMLTAFKKTHKPSPPAAVPDPPKLEMLQIQEKEETMPEYKRSAAERVEDLVHQLRNTGAVKPSEIVEPLLNLLTDYRQLVTTHDALAARLDKLLKDSPNGALGGSTIAPEQIRGGQDRSQAHPGQQSLTLEEIYRYVVAHAAKDPGVLEILTRRPELRVKVERVTIEAKGSSLRGQMALLIHKKFFDTPKTASAAHAELQRLGIRGSKPSVYQELDKLAEMGFVTKETDGYKAVPDMKASIEK